MRVYMLTHYGAKGQQNVVIVCAEDPHKARRLAAECSRSTEWARVWLDPSLSEIAEPTLWESGTHLLSKLQEELPSFPETVNHRH